MKAAKRIVSVVLMLALCVGAFFLGRATAPRTETQTFYARIDEIYEGSMTVSGLDINDINHRGRFHFSVNEDTELIWHHTQISADDLDVGDTVSITYTGSILEISPAVIENVLRIELLDDEK